MNESNENVNKSAENRNDRDTGQVAYEGYCLQSDWKSLVSGAELPPWEGLAPEIQQAWDSAAASVLLEISERIAAKTIGEALDECIELLRSLVTYFNLRVSFDLSGTTQSALIAVDAARDQAHEYGVEDVTLKAARQITREAFGGDGNTGAKGIEGDLGEHDPKMELDTEGAA